MSWIAIVDGKTIPYAQISHATAGAEQNIKRNERLQNDDFFPFEHPERYIETKKFIYAYHGAHPLKKRIIIQMEDEGFNIKYKHSISKTNKAKMDDLNNKYYDKHQKIYYDKNCKNENKLYFYEQCCDLLGVYMKLLDPTSIDRKDFKNDSNNYPDIYTKNNLKLSKEAEQVFDGIMDDWGYPETMEDYMKDPYEQFLLLPTEIVEDLTKALTKLYKKQQRILKKRNRNISDKEYNNQLKERIKKYKLDHKNAIEEEAKPQKNENVQNITSENSEPQDEFNGGF